MQGERRWEKIDNGTLALWFVFVSLFVQRAQFKKKKKKKKQKKTRKEKKKSACLKTERKKRKEYMYKNWLQKGAVGVGRGGGGGAGAKHWAGV